MDVVPRVQFLQCLHVHISDFVWSPVSAEWGYTASIASYKIICTSHEKVCMDVGLS